MREIVGIKADLRDVIQGNFCLSWEDHVEAWALSDRPNTLVIRFEEMVMLDRKTLQTISSFIGRPPVNEFDLSFDTLHAKSLLFFRHGSNEANISEMSCDDLVLFEKLHGDKLRRLGYPLVCG